MKKSIWIINHHALTPDMSGGTRHYDFARELVARGYRVTIIASSFHYARYEEMRCYPVGQNYLIEQIDGIDFVWIQTPPYRGNGLGRVKSMLSFMQQTIQTVPALDLAKPDIIIGSSVHLFAVYAAYRLSKQYRTPFIMEVRDLWPQTLIDMGISKWHPFIILLGMVERYLYRRADEIITNLPFAYRYIGQYVPRDKIRWISNGVNLGAFDQAYQQRLDPQKFNVLYMGTHGLANNLEVLIDAANRLKDEKRIHFTLIGDGPSKEALIDKSKNLGLDTVTFLSSVPKKEVIHYLKSSDLLYVGLKNLPLYRFGMSMNKIFDYMGAKKPILFVSAIEDNIVLQAKAGIVIREDDIQTIADTIADFSIMSHEKLDQYGNNGYRYIQKYYTIGVLVDKLEEVFRKVLGV